ncbi:MAG: NAD(P)-dependent alcohol dehydrogenase [Pseudomonadota bacterium]
MKALLYKKYGPPEVLYLAEVAKPHAKADEILVRVRAVEATKSDCEMRRFRFAVNWFWLPLRLAAGLLRPRRQILGGYFSGEVVALGEQVKGFQVGDAVYGCTGLKFGAYAEFLTLSQRSTLVPKPSRMSYAQASAVPLGGLNAYHFIELAALQSGESILINGAAGSIGAHAIQIAKAKGARVVAVDAMHKRDFVMALGADEFVDYQSQSLNSLSDTFDVVFDMVPGSSYGALLRLLTSSGRYFCGNPRLITMLRCTLTNLFSKRSASFAFARETRAELRALTELIEGGLVNPIVERVYAMEDAAIAHSRVEAEERVGALVLSFDPASANEL